MARFGNFHLFPFASHSPSLTGGGDESEMMVILLNGSHSGTHSQTRSRPRNETQINKIGQTFCVLSLPPTAALKLMASFKDISFNKNGGWIDTTAERHQMAHCDDGGRP